MNISLILESFLAKVNMESYWLWWVGFFFEREKERFVLNLHDRYKPAVQDEQFAMTLQGMYKSLPACFNFLSKRCSENSRAAELSI